MADIVAFDRKPKQSEPDRIWTCAHCGCQTFYLYESGVTECGLCKFKGDDATGGWLEGLNKADDFDTDIPPRAQVDHDTADFARESVMRSVDKDTVVFMAAWPNGRIRLWSVFSENDTPERKEWLRGVMRVAASLAFGERDDVGSLPE